MALTNGRTSSTAVVNIRCSVLRCTCLLNQRSALLGGACDKNHIEAPVKIHHCVHAAAFNVIRSLNSANPVASALECRLRTTDGDAAATWFRGWQNLRMQAMSAMSVCSWLGRQVSFYGGGSKTFRHASDDVLSRTRHLPAVRNHGFSYQQHQLLWQLLPVYHPIP